MERTKPKKDISAIRRAAANRRRIYEHECDYCGGKFDAIVTAKYCSSLCRVYAWREGNSNE